MKNKARRTAWGWAILWRSRNRLDGVTEHLVGESESPVRTVLFNTRREARLYRDEKFGYIKNQADLKAEPHGWELPKVIKVRIVIEAGRGESGQGGGR